MALGRPADAVEAYQAALGFEDYSARGKALANLGLAYNALGQHEEAVRSFEKALNLHNHTLSPGAEAAYTASQASLRTERQTIEGWVTGEMPPAIRAADDSEGWDAGALEALASAGDARESSYEPGAVDIAAIGGPGAGVVDDDAEVLAFLNRTEDDMRRQDREQRRAERQARRGEKTNWKPVLAFAIGLVALTVLLGALFYSGYGWPTQMQTTKGLLDAQKEGRPIASYWVAVPERDVRKEMAKIPPMKSFTVDSIERGSSLSTATVTVDPEGGAPLHYKISLEREGVGWKVSGVENDWRSSGGGS